MPDTEEQLLTLITSLSPTDYVRIVKDPTGVPDSANIKLSDFLAALSSGSNSIVDGRLTLESGVPVSTTNQTAKTSVYFTPYTGNKIALYDGSSKWEVIEFTEKAVAVPATVTTPFDVFGYNNAGVLTLETVNLTNDTTRATNIVLQDGVYVKSGAPTRRYLGTGRTTGVSGQCEDSLLKRFLWNKYNKALRPLHFTTSEGSWTYATNSWRQRNSDANSKVELVVGLLEDTISLRLVSSLTSSGAAYGSVGISEDVTNAPHADAHQQGGGSVATAWFPFCSTLNCYPQSIGYHYYAWIEWASTTTITFYGGTGAVPYRGGLNGYVMG